MWFKTGITVQCLIVLENKGYVKKLMGPHTLQTLTLGHGVRFNWTYCIHIRKGKQHSNLQTSFFFLNNEGLYI